MSLILWYYYTACLDLSNYLNYISEGVQGLETR